MSESEDHTFESANAGASLTFPMQASAIRKGGHIVIKDRPCKVVEVSTSKTGKHGHAKCHFVAIDIFNGKKYDDIVPSSHNSDVPNVKRTDYVLASISDDGYVSLLMDTGEIKEDLKMPEDQQLADQIQSMYDAGKDITVSVVAAMGIEQIQAVKENTTAK